MSHMRTEEQLSNYLSTINVFQESEVLTVKTITLQLLERKAFVSNKDVIMELIERLETEKDEVQKDILRNALEMLLQRTPDDI